MVVDGARAGATASPRGRSLAKLLRPQQWTKNLLLFAGLVFAVELDNAGAWAATLAAFVAYCAASSAAYVVNDLRDVEHDRAHPVKRERPLVRGDVSTHVAWAAAVGLLAGAFALVVPLGWTSIAFLVAFVAVQAAYSFGLKHWVLIDVFAIAALFVIRAAAGADAIEVRISPWLLVCTALLALFLAFAKRRGELLLMGADETPGRPVLEGYSLELVDHLLTVVAASAISAYSIYTFTATDSDAMMVTIPFVVFGIFRYLLLVHRRNLGEEPERVLVSDVPILLTVAGWGIASALVLTLS